MRPCSMLSVETRILVSMETLTAETASSRPREAQLITMASTANKHTLGRRESRGAQTFTNHPLSSVLHNGLSCTCSCNCITADAFYQSTCVFFAHIGLCCSRPGSLNDLPGNSKALNPICSTVRGGWTPGDVEHFSIKYGIHRWGRMQAHTFSDQG